MNHIRSCGGPAAERLATCVKEHMHRRVESFMPM